MGKFVGFILLLCHLSNCAVISPGKKAKNGDDSTIAPTIDLPIECPWWFCPDFVPPSGPVEEQSQAYWLKVGQSVLEQQLRKGRNENIAKNLIIFIGDGMGLSTQAATRIHMGNDNVELAFEKFPYIGLAKTYCVNYQVPDSSCTANAILSGVKTNYGVIGWDGNVQLRNCSAEHEDNKIHSILKWAQLDGHATGLVTTTRITHATPATAYASAAARYYESDEGVPEGCTDIAHQLVWGEVGSNLTVILGGGRRHFLPNTVSGGRRTDNRNLIEEWRTAKKDSSAIFVSTRDDLMNIEADRLDHLFGLFNNDHLEYHLHTDRSNEPTLLEMVSKAMQVLTSNSNRGYVLVVEGGRIDQGHHQTKAHLAIDETVEFHKAVEYARANVDVGETLILVTADHSNTLTVGGYPPRGTDIFAPGDYSPDDSKSIFTLSYANGAGYFDHFNADGGRVDPYTLDYKAADFRHPATAPLEDETHAGEDVGVYAEGPWAHLFTGVYEQNYIAHGMMYAACLGPDDRLFSEQCLAYRNVSAKLRSSAAFWVAFFVLVSAKFHL